jgi:hypothetical protein
MLDLGEPSAVCEMCEVQLIRYVHTMSHPNYENLECGCICAGNMEGDGDRARSRERGFMAGVKKRRGFPGLRSWRTSKKGNKWIHLGDFRVTVFSSDRGYNFVRSDRDGGQKEFGRGGFDSFEEAAIAAYDSIGRKSR